MYALTSKLLKGSAVSPGTHPVLVSLLELAAQPPCIDKNGFPDATSWESFRKRVQRDWDKLAGAFKAACLAGITDEMLVEACPSSGLSFSASEGWKLHPFEPDTYRKRVASLIEKASDYDHRGMLPPLELAKLVKKFDKAITAELALKRELHAAGYLVYAAGIVPHVKALQNTRSDIKAENRP